jgi:hypothetical protein
MSICGTKMVDGDVSCAGEKLVQLNALAEGMNPYTQAGISKAIRGAQSCTLKEDVFRRRRFDHPF